MSQIDFLSKFLIMIKSPIYYLGKSSCLSHFCLEHASLVLSVSSMYVCCSLQEVSHAFIHT